MTKYIVLIDYLKPQPFANASTHANMSRRDNLFVACYLTKGICPGQGLPLNMLC